MYITWPTLTNCWQTTDTLLTNHWQVSDKKCIIQYNYWTNGLSEGGDFLMEPVSHPLSESLLESTEIFCQTCTHNLEPSIRRLCLKPCLVMTVHLIHGWQQVMNWHGLTQSRWIEGSTQCGYGPPVRWCTMWCCQSRSCIRGENELKILIHGVVGALKLGCFRFL